MSARSKQTLYLALQSSVVLAMLAMPGLAQEQQDQQTQNVPYTQGLAAMGKGDLRAAITNFNQAVTNNLKDWHSFEKRGECLYQLGDYHLAIADFTSALQVNSKCADAYLWRANAHCKLAKPDQGISDYKQAVQLDPTKIAILCQKATFGDLRQIPKNAPITQANAQALLAPPPDLHLRAALFATGKDPNAVITELNQAISIDPLNSVLLYKRGLAYMQLRKTDTALSNFDDAIMANPNNASFYLARAYLYHTLNNDILAKEDIVQAQFTDPGLPKNIDFANPEKKEGAKHD